ncbi:microtubule-associated protein 9 isoform X3 [Leucoraja erinacea]|uniref:microtubule-associated protein 9 isoform X3 n=1 Tax=Leucoraja erinaceus TaxID=7782 RepID=UPI002455F488|nr:microtubule-associated protein 9 isoform X3 [Leucoraja erinacea]
MLRCGQMRASGNINRMLEEEDITTTSAYAKCQDELRRPVAVRAMKQSTNEENYVKDFDYELMKDFGIKTRTASSEKTEKKPLMCHYVFPDYEKPRRIFMKNTKNNDAELNILTITEKPAEHHHNNDQWSPPSFLKSAKSNWRENEGKAPIPKPRDYKMKQSSSTERETKSSLSGESPKPRPRYNLLKDERNYLEKQDDNLFNMSQSPFSSAVKHKLHSGGSHSEYSRSASLLSKASSLNISRSTSSIPDARFADYIEAQVQSPTDSDVTGSYANDRINGKISPIAGAQFEDNNTNDEVKTKLKHLLRAEANVDHWQSQMFKPNLEQHVTDHAIPDSFMRNSSKLKEKDQARMEWIGNKGQNPKSHRKSNDSRSLNSPVQTMGRSSAGKSPQSKTTEPRYLGTLKILDSKALPNETSNLEAPDTIRASIYQVWLERKKHLLHEDKKQQKLKTQHENEKREQKIIENKEDAKASFEAWRRKKKNAFQRTDDKKKEEERAKQQAEAEKEEKKGEAEKVFEKWKEEKDQNLKGTLQKQKQIKREKKEKEKEQVTERKKENTSAFMKWNENKRIVLKQKKKEIAKDEQKKKIEEEYTKTGREEMAALVYEKWLEQKDKKEKKQKKIKSASYSDPPPPWSPPNKTIPFRK